MSKRWFARKFLLYNKKILFNPEKENPQKFSQISFLVTLQHRNHVGWSGQLHSVTWSRLGNLLCATSTEACRRVLCSLPLAWLSAALGWLKRCGWEAFEHFNCSQQENEIPPPPLLYVNYKWSVFLQQTGWGVCHVLAGATFTWYFEKLMSCLILIQDIQQKKVVLPCCFGKYRRLFLQKKSWILGWEFIPNNSSCSDINNEFCLHYSKHKQSKHFVETTWKAMKTFFL